jgi:ABC-type multidrug transport system permease subunit
MRNKEFIRDRSALGWSLVFPIFVIFGFSYSFSDKSQDLFKVARIVVAGSQGEIGQDESFDRIHHIQFVDSSDLDESLAKLKRHQFDMVLLKNQGGSGQYWISSSSPKGYLLEKILRSTEKDHQKFEKQTVTGREIRYVDWLIAGLLGMNMMFSALFGVGYNIVRYRKNGVLKRLRATPLSSFEFLLVQVASRLLLIICVTTMIFLGCHWFIHFQMLGSYFDLFIVMVLGAMCLISLGLLVASRTASEEFAGGLLNFISWPMMFLSGVWVSLEGAAPWVKSVAQMLPLTHLIDASRSIMTEGADLRKVSGHLVVLVAMTLVFLFTGSIAFKWK